MIRAIKTRYKDIIYRSRVEARWAIFFDVLRVKHWYEYEGFVVDHKPYLPDFYLPDLKCFVEIKGIKPTKEEQELAYALARDSGMPVHIFSGSIPQSDMSTWADEGFETFTFDTKGKEVMPKQLYLKEVYAVNKCSMCGTVGIVPRGWMNEIGCCERSPSIHVPHPDVVRAYRLARSARFEY
jgi:hypothetical protein